MDLNQSAVLRSRLTLLETISRAIRLDTVVALAASAMSFAVCGKFETPPMVWALAGGPAIMAMIVWMLAQQLLRRPPPLTKIRTWENLYGICVGINGLSWGAYIAAVSLLMASSSPLVYVLIGLAALLATLKLGTYAGAANPVIFFASGALIPAAGVIGRSFGLFDLLTAGLLIVFVVTIVIATKSIATHVNKALMVETDNEELRGQLERSNTQVEKLNVALKTNEDKRDQAETNLRRTVADLGLAEGKAKALATTLERVSPLCQVTGLANRRHFDQNLDNEWRRAMREGSPVSLLLVSVDEFESYVESHGHQSGDTLLKRIGQAMKGFGRRAGDMAGRYDETTLALLLPRCDVRNALRMAEALRKRVEASKITHSGAQSRDIVTVHVGLATTKPGRGLADTELLARTDAALYEARFQGGNKVVSYRPLSQLKLERWDQNNDGVLNDQSLMQKLLVWGYDTTQQTYHKSDPVKEYTSGLDSIIALLNGEILLELEGHNMSVRAGDSIFVPRELVVHLKVTSEQPATIFTATKSE